MNGTAIDLSPKQFVHFTPRMPKVREGDSEIVMRGGDSDEGRR